MNDADFIAAMQQGLPPLPQGLEVLELGNADLVASSTWTGRTAPSEYAPLPQYPQSDDLPERPTHQREPESLKARLEREAKRNALGDVAFCAASLLVGAGGALLVGGIAA